LGSGLPPLPFGPLPEDRRRKRDARRTPDKPVQNPDDDGEENEPEARAAF